MPFPLRRGLAVLAASCLGLSAAPAAFAAGCGSNSAHEAFDVQGLKSELMVTALSCSAQDRYNAFVEKFRPKLLSEDAELNGYFRSAYGRNAQREHDDYITQLANVQSEGGLRAGTIFCMQRVAMFDEVNALEDGADLSHYAEAKDIVQPASFETCAAPVAESRQGVVRRRVIAHHRTRA
ncbi:hypothetical protein [Tanticharoenia sakaeratensis]|jgi:hypothetical protein|uniref:Lipoprotein n=1 Tax=Tanticharoenia sakaeratensis NBRC 103193 TaxID=1231623 RepID=A0A0D6MPC1_9PROT|nr:hypothetical protein [Tanticharoenia sakaeratensis]GAN55534.1 hypothetical protein Tasa_048_159 [Tanticharoenia sakaeratensis NBRC 103193]GBQ21804.1 hypothetical protein AA103193_1853 [Tanticharoenia sakaeratensis NBRC 103193]